MQGCEELWHGIDVYGSLRMSGSKVEDAKYAVSLQEGAGLVILAGNTFDKNYIGLRIPPHSSGLHASGNWWLANNFQVRSLGITGNHITVSPAGQSNEGVGIGIWNTIPSFDRGCCMLLKRAFRAPMPWIWKPSRRQTPSIR